MTLVARSGALSDIGLHRKTNEDAFVVAPPLYAVCDGMGGAQAGEVASALAAETLAAGVAAGRPLLESAEAANAAVFARASDDVAHSGMGTTLTAFIQEGALAHFVHIGDSRAYLLRKGALQQLSDDHSLVGEMMREGRLTEEEAATHPHRSILSRALGTEPAVRIDEFEMDLLGGDVLLLCSDGLSGVADAAALAKAMGRADPDDAVRRLIAEARKNGGPDNITAVVVRFETPDPDAGDDEVTLIEPAAPADDEVTLVEPPPAPESVADDPEDAAPVVPPAPGTAFGDTMYAPGAAASAAAEDEEDTGEIPVAEVAAAVAAASPHPVPELPGAGQQQAPAHGRRRLGCLTVVLALLVLLGIGGAVTLSTVYYVGVDDGRLAVYSGLPASVGPLHLHAVYRRSGVEYASLSPQARSLVDERALRGRAAALALASHLGMDP